MTSKDRSIDSLGDKVMEMDLAQGNVTGPGSGLNSGGRTPTQEVSEFEVRGITNEPLSKRRGSDTLSIGIPMGGNSRSRPAFGQNGLQSTPVATPRSGDASAMAGSSRAGTQKPGLPSGKPTIARQGVLSNSAIVGNDSDDDDEEKGYEAEGDAEANVENPSRDNLAYKKNGGGTSPPFNNHHPHRSPSASSSYSNSTVKKTNSTKLNTHANGSQNDGYIPSQQPVRNHHHRSDTTDSIASSRREKEGMKPFPTPGAKGQRNPFEGEKSFEEVRLDEAEAKEKHWKRWGPYLSERQWVREIRLWTGTIVIDRFSSLGTRTGYRQRRLFR